MAPLRGALGDHRSHCGILLACSLAHRPCGGVQAVEDVEAVEHCAVNSDDPLRGALGDDNFGRRCRRVQLLQKFCRVPSGKERSMATGPLAAKERITRSLPAAKTQCRRSWRTDHVAAHGGATAKARKRRAPPLRSEANGVIEAAVPKGAPRCAGARDPASGVCRCAQNGQRAGRTQRVQRRGRFVWPTFK